MKNQAMLQALFHLFCQKYSRPVATSPKNDDALLAALQDIGCSKAELQAVLTFLMRQERTKEPSVPKDREPLSLLFPYIFQNIPLIFQKDRDYLRAFFTLQLLNYDVDPEALGITEYLAMPFWEEHQADDTAAYEAARVLAAEEGYTLDPKAFRKKHLMGAMAKHIELSPRTWHARCVRFQEELLKMGPPK